MSAMGWESMFRAMRGDDRRAALEALLAVMEADAAGEGGDGARGGVSRDKVSVVVAANPRGGVFLQEACLGKPGVEEARRAMAGCAVEGAVVSTDLQKGYVRALREMGAAAHLRFASGGSPAPLNLVNAVHSALKTFLARFRGVSTRRLHGYLMWFKWQREARRLGDLPGAVREHMGRACYRLSWRERVRAPYPFHPEMTVQIEG